MTRHDEMRFNTTPNWLTAFRIAMVPAVVALLFQKTPVWDVVAAVIFAIASITDFFDGYIARKQNVVTIYGKLMDPLADKFLVVSCLIMLQELGWIHPVIVILLICRELAITGLRALASAEGVIIPASASAKWKTASQMVAIPLVMLKRHALVGPYAYPVGQWLIYLSLAISLWSAKDYIVDFIRAARQKRLQAREEKIRNRSERKAKRKRRKRKKQR